MQGKHRRGRWLGIAALALIVTGGIVWTTLDHGPEANAAIPAATVEVAAPLSREVLLWDDYVGRFSASNTVEVRPRVSGAITAVHFRDGDYVRKGQPLFTVDPRTFRAALAEAQADVASARSALELARADYARVSDLTGDEAIAASEIDALRAKVRATTAALAAAQARVRGRALDLEFTTVRAPISGRVSDRRIDAGNLVSGDGGSSATLLTTINAIDPIRFDFDASEALFLKAQRDRAAKRDLSDVDVRLQDEANYRWHGRLDFTDNAIDPRSGTIRLRAEFANPDGFLTPGMFGNMRLASGGKAQAMLVPDAAVQPDQSRKIVLVVGKDGTVAAKPVEPGPLVDGLRVIRKGLSPQDRVVVSNFGAAVPGSKVEARLGKIVPTRDTTTPTSPEAPAAAQATLID
ncbi:efflux RND transporter periplasmic adaptor subunit [Novosphingobium aquimarinum]|uniref:efflux RND transporter periplasmic adaptor subunit n=1 Tax=Novosphingobium aquimarinum TaxID=2682494 RepID=UPI0012EBCF3D|nr:efflux RND transporter periplasmic adaptor subunit [Novosphingobium aquimarinum]